MEEEATSQKNEGNKHFKDGRYEEALSCYTEALKLNPKAGAETAVYYKNRAACQLKLKRFTPAATDSTAALELVPNDPKALFRRCQAFEAMGRPEDAYRDATTLLKLDPKNSAVQPVLKRLTPVIQDRIKKQNSTDNQVSQMFDLTFASAESGDTEKQKQAANNLIVLAREDAGARKIYENGGVNHLLRLLETSRDPELQLTAVRVLGCLARNSKERAKNIFNIMTLKTICVYIGLENEDVSLATTHLLQNMINSMTDLEQIKKDRDQYETNRIKKKHTQMRPFPLVYEKIDPDGIEFGDTVFPALIMMLTQGKCSKHGRDNTLELIIKFVTRRDGCGWSKKFIQTGGIQGLLEVAGALPEHKALPVTVNARLHASLVLSKIFDDLLSDQERDLYREAVNKYFDDMFSDNIFESKLEALMALAAVLQGPYEVGNSVLGRPGVMEMMLALANSDNAVHIKYAVEALVHAVSKKDRCSSIIKQATPILKELYQSQSDTIKVRALVGLCKLGSFGGSDASAKSLADGSTLSLAKACRKFLVNPSKDVDLRKWAADGLAYLSLDAEVKEELVQDSDAIRSLIDLAKTPDKGVLYPVATIFVNITNSHDKKEYEPEMLELARFAKHHIPEDHEKDKEPYVSERRKKLVKEGMVSALVALSDTDSENTKTLLARVFLSICCDIEHRGLVVQGGGAKVLVKMANEGSIEGKSIAAQGLAKIGITSNPEIAFPGQRSLEVVRPLILLLNVERSALQNFEALMALTNLAAMNDSVRKRILKEDGLAMIEYYSYEEHDQLRRASIECMCNMIMNEKVQESFKGENDRLKLFVLFSGEFEDEALVRAASGGLAMLTGDKEICHKLVTCTEQWFEILQNLAAHPKPDIQHRGVHIIMNLMSTDKEIATRLVESTMLEVLMAVSKIEDADKQAAKKCADQALDQAVEWNLIQPQSRQKSS